MLHKTVSSHIVIGHSHLIPIVEGADCLPFGSEGSNSSNATCLKKLSILLLRTLETLDANNDYTRVLTL